MASHFSFSKAKMKRDVLSTDDEGNQIEFFASAFLQYKTDWDDDAGRFKPMTEEQQETVMELWEACADAGVQISVGLFQRTGGQARDWPKVLQLNLYCNDPEA